MGLLCDFKEASVPCKIVLVLLLIASLLSLTSYSTTSWVYNGKAPAAARMGLWRSCANTVVPTSCSILDGTSNVWWGAVQGLVSMGTFGILISLIIVTKYMFCEKWKKNKDAAFGVAVICIVTGALYMIGVIVFGVKVNKWPEDGTTTEYKLGYSFALSAAALVLEVVVGMIMIIEGRSTNSVEGRTKPSA